MFSIPPCHKPCGAHKPCGYSPMEKGVHIFALTKPNESWTLEKTQDSLAATSTTTSSEITFTCLSTSTSARWPASSTPSSIRMTSTTSYTMHTSRSSTRSISTERMETSKDGCSASVRTTSERSPLSTARRWLCSHLTTTTALTTASGTTVTI